MPVLMNPLSSYASHRTLRSLWMLPDQSPAAVSFAGVSAPQAVPSTCPTIVMIRAIVAESIHLQPALIADDRVEFGFRVAAEWIAR
jgi:hypothetical protein